MNARRVLPVTAIAVACAWTGLVIAFGGLHFDDFINLGESRGALALTAEEWMKPAADGRWQPLKRLTFDVFARSAGLTFWPYALALAAAHVMMAAGTASAARAIWQDRDQARTAFLVALAALNLTAYSTANVGSLHGILCVALTVWSVALALHAALTPRGRAWRVALSMLAILGACWFKESAVTAPALALYGVWLASRVRHVRVPEMVRAMAVPEAGIVLYLAARIAFDVPLIPARSRYALGGSWPFVRNALIVVANVLPWAAAAFLASGRHSRHERRHAIVAIVILAGAAVAAVFPSLLLTWTSPNFWYAAAPVAALGTAGLIYHAPRPDRAGSALALLMVLALAGVSAAAFERGAHRWGPYSEATVKQWGTFPRHGGRVVWFDADTHARYGGLVRTVGPGLRLTQALRLATGDQSIEAETCISVLVAPLYVPQPGDELFMHSGGRLEPIDEPPPGRWYCLR